MPHFPEHVEQIIADAVREHPNCVSDATHCACKKIESLKDFKHLLPKFFQVAVQHQIFDVRHHINIRRRNGDMPISPAKVNPLSTDAVNAVYDSIYSYYIGGKTLGSLTGAEVRKTAHDERLIADGHLFNAQLCESLSPLVKDGECVSDVVSETKLNALFKKLRRKDEAA